MARGDAVSIVTNGLAAAATLQWQPAAGVEIMVTEFMSEQWQGSAPNSNPDTRVAVTTGGPAADAYIRLDTEVTGHASPAKIFITNSVYILMLNQNASAADTGALGVQTK